MTDSASKRFEEKWKITFPGDPLPSLTCFNSEGSKDTEQSAYRNSLKVALDYHTERINDLEKKLSKEQFILEYIAHELEQLPVPRESKMPPLIRPKPSPRTPPPIPKKPPPELDQEELSGGALRRTNTAPTSQVPNDRRILFSSFHQPASNEKINNRAEKEGSQKNRTSCKVPDETRKDVGSLSQDVGIQDNSVSGNLIESNDTEESVFAQNEPEMRKKVGRDSMRQMDPIIIQDYDSLDDSSDDSNSKSEYMTLWGLAPSGRKPHVEAPNTVASDLEEPEDVSTPSDQSHPGVITKKGSKMIRVDYGSSAGPVAIKQDSSDNNKEDSDSDQEDDKPQYVRLIALFSKPYNNNLRPASPSAQSTDSTEVAVENNGNIKRVNTETYPQSQSMHQIHLHRTESMADESGLTSNSHQMRNWVINNVLQGEITYLEDLDVLLKYKKSLDLAAESTQPMVSKPDITAIYGNLQEIYDLHHQFKNDLQPIVASWTMQSQVAQLFKNMTEKLHMYQMYLDNFPKAISTLKRCCQEHPKFNDLVKEIKCPSSTEKQHLEQILHRPITRMQRNSLVLQDLLQCTLNVHPDFLVLKKTLEDCQIFLREKIRVTSTGSGAPLHVLVKNQLLVEYVSDRARKLRHVFLFNDILVCTKCTINNGRHNYVVKWFVSISDMELSDKIDDTPVEWKKKVEKADREITVMKSRIKDLKESLRKEIKECKDKKMDSTTNAKVQRLTRKIQEQEGNLILAEPKLRLTIRSNKGAQYCFLLPSDYERREWLETLNALKRKVQPTSKRLTLLEAQSIVDLCKDTVQLNNVGQMVMNEATDEDIISGQLTVTVHKILGLQQPCDTYAAMEVDSFGHFYLKAKTSVLVKSQYPAWNESFEIDLEASTTLRLICYQKTLTGDVLLGKCRLNLNKQWLKQGFQEKELSMNEVTLAVSIQYKTAEQTIRRLPSIVDSGVYGVKLSTTCKKEGTLVPAVVTECIKDVEKRGLDEVGIYRVSASTSDVQRIKKAFDKNIRAGQLVLQEMEINAVTGALKLYFRELPEALFPEDLYPSLIEAYKKKDKDEQEKQMIELMKKLPEPNYHTMMAILNHLIKVGQHEAANKMPFHNLAVVFGPTLLKPADKTVPTAPVDLFSSGANDAMYQSGMLFLYLTIVSKGIQFR